MRWWEATKDVWPSSRTAESRRPPAYSQSKESYAFSAHLFLSKAVSLAAHNVSLTASPPMLKST